MTPSAPGGFGGITLAINVESADRVGAAIKAAVSVGGKLLKSDKLLRLLFAGWGVAHLAFGVAGTAFPRWFFGAVPPWPPLHVGQIQIAGIFDLAMAAAFLIAATDVARYAVLMIAVGIVAEWGHALVRIGHIVAGDNSPADLVAPLFMLAFGAILAVAGAERWHGRRANAGHRPSRRESARVPVGRPGA